MEQAACLAHEEGHDVVDVLAHGVGQQLGRQRLVIPVRGQVGYQGAYAVGLVRLVADGPRIALGPA